MTLTRRAFNATAAAAIATPAFAAARPAPVIIGHRGASGERPEHTRSAYLLAIQEGADFIEPDLCLTKDGHMVVRHENEIGGTTNIAAHPEFAARKTAKTIDGERIEGWFTEDFTLAELKTLRARERLPQVRPASAAFDGTDPILTFEEVVEIARAETKRTGRTIGVYPEMKHPSHFAGVGLAFEGRMAAALKAAGLDAHDAPVFVQCFEVAPLKTLRPLTRAPLVQLMSLEGGPADNSAVSYAQMATADGLKAISAYADGVGPEWKMVVPVTDGGLAAPTAFVSDAHAAGLTVHPWTVRAENIFLPAKLKRGGDPAVHGDVDALYDALFKAGVDGLFSDFPGLAVQARTRFLKA
jgi:glycerophosphoryl diester phosphodiesterase